jgi:serine protease
MPGIRRSRPALHALPLALFAAFLPLAAAAPAAAPAAAAPRVDLRALATAKSFDRFVVRFRADSAPARDPRARTLALERAVVRTRQQLQRAHAARGDARPQQDWRLDARRRLGVGADLVLSSARLDRAQAALLLRQLGADPDVEYVHADEVLHADFVPSDSNYASLWGMQDADAGIRADKAWDLGKGAGAVVAVVDTGFTDHGDLAANILPGYDMISDPARANDGDGRDADAHDPGDWTPGVASSWHGTHVAGTIAAVGNNAQGVIGVAWSAKVVPVRVLGVGGGDGSDIADGITWASGGSVPGAPANPNPAEVINLSLGGGGGCSATYQAAIDGANARGTLVVVSAGNSSLDAASGSLATCNGVVVVGANTSTSARSSFSNYGALVDVSAPGSSILSTINTGSTTPAAEGYTYYQGTSMAAPHVSGAAALAQAYRVARGGSPYTPGQLEARLKATAYPMTQGCADSSGAGIVDARTLLDVADDSTTLLADGIAVTGQSAGTGTGLRYAMASTTRAQGLNFSSTGGSGNADLYVRYGSAPTTSAFDCSSTLAGNGESCVVANAQPGTYYVLLQAASGYSSVAVTGAASGNRKPVPGFASSASGLSVAFTDASSDSDGGVSSRKWKFGDGGSSNQVNPTHAYNLAGAYTVQLTATDGSGASNCTLRQLDVNPLPVALANGVAKTGLAARTGAQLPFTLAVPADAGSLHFSTVGGSGDADLYVKFGSQATPSDFDCVSGSATATEDCDIPDPQAGTWYATVHAYSDISNVSLTGTHDGTVANLPPNAAFASSSNGLTANFTDTSTDADGSIVARAWDFGDGTGSSTANPSHTYAAGGTYTVQLTVTDNGGMQDTRSASVTVTAPVSISLSVGDAAIDEGNSSRRTLSFTVQLSNPAPSAVRYNIATSDDTATAGSDYIAKSLSGVAIAAGATSKAFTVSIKGDTAVEPDETFKVSLSNVTGATLADAQAVGTIRNDDGGSGGGGDGSGGTPSLRIDDVSIAEGDSGTRQLAFTVSLSAAAAGNVSYNIATANGTATAANNDYVAASLVGQVIPAGQTSKTFSVTVNGDTTVERSERVRVNVSGIVGATIADALGIGTILNDD